MVHQKRLLEQGILAVIRAGHHKLEAARANVESAKQSVADAAENRDLNQRAYEAELVETEDVISAQLMETFTKARYVKAVFDHKVAAAELDLASGRMLASLRVAAMPEEPER
jgi:outer membrane protein TolC